MSERLTPEELKSRWNDMLAHPHEPVTFVQTPEDPCYSRAYYRFRARIGEHIGVGPYEPISEEQMQQWVDEFKAEIDAWHASWKQIKREVQG